MAVARSLIPRLTDIVEAIERVNGVMAGMPLDAFEADWQKQWLVERGVEIVSEASRHLTDSLKARHPEIPWRKVAGIGNVLRHDYENIAAPAAPPAMAVPHGFRSTPGLPHRHHHGRACSRDLAPTPFRGMGLVFPPSGRAWF